MGFCERNLDQALVELRTLTDAFEASPEGIEVEECIRKRLLTDDRSLLRFLRAVNGDVATAFQELIDCVRWYAAEQPHRLSCQTIELHFSHGKNYHNARDRIGRPVVYMRMARDPPGDDAGKVKIMIYNLERSLRLLEEGNVQGESFDERSAESIVWIVDCQGFSYFQHTNLAMASEVSDLLTHRYPERLGKLLLLNAPWTFRAFWGAVSRFLQPTTVEKVVFCSGDEIKQTLLDSIDESSLERCYGGTNDFEYCHDEYFSQLLREDAQRGVGGPSAIGTPNTVLAEIRGDELV